MPACCTLWRWGWLSSISPRTERTESVAPRRSSKQHSVCSRRPPGHELRPLQHTTTRRTIMTKPILIIGAGPVGMTMACELARYGVAVRIIDKAAQRTDKSKALVLWSRTLELLDRGGGSASFIDAGFKAEAVNFVAGDKLIGRVGMDGVHSPYPYGLMLPQSQTERLLEERLQNLG